jgi:hypothetical protein
VQASSGDFYSGGGATLSWTLGEAATETYSNTSNALTQGFQQPDLTITKVEEADAGVSVTVFPNPSAGQLNVSLSSAAARRVKLELLDASGRLVHTQQADVPAGDQSLSMSLASLAAGQYLLRITDTEQNTQSTYKILKNK